MRIALFTETYLPHINGVVTHVKILRDGLVQLGHEVLVVTADAEARHHSIVPPSPPRSSTTTASACR